MSQATNVHTQKNNCSKTIVNKESCYVSFGNDSEEIVKALVVSAETVRGETLVLELNKEGKVVGIDIFAPGMKSCQPIWDHNREEEKK